jgi:Fe-S cluster biogenesis protein NfuA
MSDISIEARPLVSPQACQFVISKKVSTKRILLKKGRNSFGSKLIDTIFAIDPIEEILIEDAVITLKKKGNSTWQELGPQIGKAIRESLSSQDYISAKLIEEIDKPVVVDEEELKGRIEDVKRLLEKQVAPALAAHGGHVTLAKITGGMVHLSFGGGCQGCAQVSVTVKDGIEKILKEELPWMEAIVDVTDHTSGDNPYY